MRVVSEALRAAAREPTQPSRAIAGRANACQGRESLADPITPLGGKALQRTRSPAGGPTRARAD
eukprot:2204546-Pyramimonas_sp.AAC.1